MREEDVILPVPEDDADPRSERERVIGEAMVYMANKSTHMRNCIREFGHSMDGLMEAVDHIQGDAPEEGRLMVTGFKTVIQEIRQMASETDTAVQDVAEELKELQRGDAGQVMEGKTVHDRLHHILQVSDRLYQIIDHLRSYNFHLGDFQQISSAISSLSDAAEQAKSSLHDFKQATELLMHHIETQQKGKSSSNTIYGKRMTEKELSQVA